MLKRLILKIVHSLATTLFSVLEVLGFHQDRGHGPGHTGSGPKP